MRRDIPRFDGRLRVCRVAHRSIAPLILTLVLGYSIGASAQSASFRGVGDLLGGSYQSVAHAVSGDGSVVVGWSDSREGPTAFRWANGVIQSLGDLPGGGFDSDARAVSSNGDVIVGTGTTGNGAEAFRWTSANGMLQLGEPLPYAYNLEYYAFAVSGNGDVAAGRLGRENLGYEAFRWSISSEIRSFGNDGGAIPSLSAQAISNDGTTIAGSAVLSGREGFEAVIWSDHDERTALGDLPGGLFDSVAYAVSADGSIVVGRGTSPQGFEAFHWSSATGMIGLGDLPGGLFQSIAYGVSYNGTIVVGTSTTTAGFEAFVWDASNGMRRIADVLQQECAIDLRGWVLEQARGISADGRTIVGTGRNQAGAEEGWVAHCEGFAS